MLLSVGFDIVPKLNIVVAINITSGTLPVLYNDVAIQKG
jgi:hypothetical protein